MNARPGLTDFHAHFVTPRYVDACRRAGHEVPDGMPWWPSWSAEEHLDQMEQCGIARAVLSVSTPGVHLGHDDGALDLARHVNDTAAELARDHHRFDFLASLPLPDVAAAVDEAVRALDDLGALGVTMLTHASGQYLGAAALEPLWEVLSARRAVVLVHPTSPPGWQALSLDRPRPMVEFMFETTRSVTDMVFNDVLGRHRGIRFVIPHCGAALPVLSDRIELFRSLMPGPDGGPAPAATTAEQLRSCWFDLAGFAFPHHARALVDLVGEDRVVYGSDYCFTPAPSTAELARQLDAASPPRSAPDWRTLTAANASRLLADLRDEV